MPTRVLEIVGYEEQIARPVVMEVVRQLAERMRIPQNVQIRYVGNGSALASVNTTLDKTPLPQRLQADTHILITVSEVYDGERGLSSRIYRPDNPFIFKDQHLDVYMWPVKNRVKYTVNIKYVATDRTSVNTWYTNIKRKYSEGVSEYLHTASYHYPIPHDHLYVLNELFNLRQRVKPFDEDIGKYLKRCFTNNMTIIGNQIGNNKEFVICEKQIRILGWCDFNTQPPAPEKDNDTGAYSVSFDYNFDYDRVEQVVMAYPFMIHNQMIPALLLPEIPQYGVEDIDTNMSVTEYLLSRYSRTLSVPVNVQTNPGIPVPIFDEWQPIYKPKGMVNLLRVMLSVSEEHPRAILDLVNELDDVSLDPIVIDYLEKNPINHLTPYDSVFNIAVYNRQNLYDTNKLILTNQCQVNSIEALDQRERYHLTFNLVHSIELLSQKALESLCSSPYLLVIYLYTLYPNIVQVAGEYYILPDGKTLFLGDPATRPSCMWVGKYRISTIIMPDGSIVQSHLIPCIFNGQINPEQLNKLFKTLIDKEPIINKDPNYYSRLINTFTVVSLRR